ncbi:hypothetical protein ACF0H5_014665 [Mactra antiquata]
MGCRPSRNTLSRVADSTCEYNRCYMKEFDHARRKQKKSARENRKRNMPTYNNFSSTSKVYDHTSGTSKITVRLSTDGSMLEIEQFDIDYRNEELSEVVENPDEDCGLVMKSVSELKALHKGRTPYGRCDSAPLLISSSSTHAQSNHKETSCGFTGCCIQNLSNSLTVSDEYKIRSDSLADGQDDDVMIEHNCEVHRDSERGKKHVVHEHDAFRKTHTPMDISNDEYVTNFTENTNVTQVSVGTGTETVNVQANVCQKTFITVKRSTLEQQVEEANKKIMEDSQYLACSTFKPTNRNDKELYKNETNDYCERNQCMPCSKHSVRQKIKTPSDEMIRHPDSLSSALTLDRNAESITTGQRSATEATDSINTNSKPLYLACSLCDSLKDNSETIDKASICSTRSCSGTCCRVQTCHGCDKSTESNSNQCYQSKCCCSQCGVQTTSTDVGVYYCCCYTNFKYNEMVDQRSSFIQKIIVANSKNGCHLEDGQICYTSNDSTHENDIINIERKAITGDLTCPECGKIYLHPVMFADQASDVKPDGQTVIACQNDGNDSQTQHYLHKREIPNDSVCIDVHGRHVDTNEMLETKRYEEMTNKRPCVPNRTVTRGSGALHNLQYLQKSITTSEEATKYISTEHFQINNCIRCAHSEHETLNAADNLKSVGMVTNEVPKARLTENRICSCRNMVYDKESIRIDEHQNFVTDVNQTTEQISSSIPCICRKHSTTVATKEQLTVRSCGTMNDNQSRENNIHSITDEEKRCSDSFPFSEYESFVVRDNRCEETEYESFVIRENKRYDETDYQDSNESSAKPLLEANNEEILTSDDNISSEEDDVDFDDSSDACVDEYVDALETTYV